MATSPRKFSFFATAVPLIGVSLAVGLFALFLVLRARYGDAAATIYSVQWVPELGVSLDVRLDAFSLLFALIITGIGALIIGYASAWFQQARQRARFTALIVCFMAAMLGAVLADDLVIMFVFWEATSLLSFLLIGFDNGRELARKAALQALLVTAGGGLALFAGVLLIGIELGTYSITAVIARSHELAASPMVVPIMILVVIGAFAKSAQFPFQFWLPNAMEAPTPASAYLHSATMVKLGVFILARFDRVFDSLPLFGTILVCAGTLTMALAIVQALTASDYKRVLAHSTVSALAVMVMLIGLAGDQALEAMVAFLVAHALYKAALFLCAGNVTRSTHEYDVHRISGVRRQLPVTAFAAVLAAASMAGLPPTVGFFAKEAVVAAQLEVAAGAIVFATALAASAGFVAVAAIAGAAPFARQRTSAAVSVHEPESKWLAIGPVILGIAGLLFGVAPGIREYVIGTAASPLTGRIPAPPHLDLRLLAISFVVIGAGAALYFVRASVRGWLVRRTSITAVSGERGYQWLFDATLRTADRLTRLTQHGDQRRYTATVISTVVLAAFVALAFDHDMASASGDVLSGEHSIRPALVILLLLMVAGAAAATRSRSLLRTMIAVGAVGFGSACVYLLNGAPDLALTQFAVEVLMIVLFTGLLLRMPDHAVATRSVRERRFDAGLAIALGAVLFVALASLGGQPLDRTIPEYFGANSRAIAHGRNVVNVIIVDYRALDTVGEVTVVALAAVAVWGLLRRRRAASDTRGGVQ